MDTCPNCDPTTAQLTEEYLPELLKQYEFEVKDFTPEQLQEIRELLLSGELDKARGILSDWAYESHGNDLTDIYVCGDCGLQYKESEGALSIDSETHESFICNACLLHTA